MFREKRSSNNYFHGVLCIQIRLTDENMGQKYQLRASFLKATEAKKCGKSHEFK